MTDQTAAVRTEAVLAEVRESIAECRAQDVEPPSGWLVDLAEGNCIKLEPRQAPIRSR